MKKVVKKFLITAAGIFFGGSPCLVAGAPSPLILEVSLTLKSGTKQTGFIVSNDNNSCEPVSHKKSQYVLVGTSYDNGEEKTFRFNTPDLLKELSNGSEINLESKLFSLNYLPKDKSQSSSVEGLKNRLAFYAFPPDSKKMRIADIASVSILKCTDLDQVIDPLTLDLEIIKSLDKPALAFFADEVDLEGMVNLISYNPQYDTLAKLENILKDFASKYPVHRKNVRGEEFPSWYSIYANEKEFRKDFLPPQVFLLMYHVAD
jgi:hypothetical protein